MRNYQDGSTGERVPSSTPAGDSPNAFTPEYLDLLNQRDEPATASDADAAGPWHLERTPEGGWAVLRMGESLAQGDTPSGNFIRPEIAKLTAGLLPGTGKSKRFRLGKEHDGRGYPVYYDGEWMGHLPIFEEDLIASLNFADALLSAPNDLSWVLDAAGAVALERTGKISLARARESVGAPTLLPPL